MGSQFSEGADRRQKSHQKLDALVTARNETLALLAIFVLIYSAVAGAVERTWVSSTRY